MGPDAIIGGQRVDGGITYSALEEVNIQLGTGDNHFVVESTHEGSTTITSGPGADVFDINEILGHTEIYTGANTDIVNVGSQVSYVAPTSTSGDTHLVNTIGALLTIDGGTDEITGTGAETTTTTTSLTDLNANFPVGLGDVAIDYTRFKVDVRTQADIGDLFVTVDGAGVPTGQLRFQANERFEDHDVFVVNYEVCEAGSANCSVHVVVIDESMLDNVDRDLDLDVRTSALRTGHVVDLAGSTIEITDDAGVVHSAVINSNTSNTLTLSSLASGVTADSYVISSILKRGDVLTVDNSGDQTDNVVTVTQTTIDGLNMPSVPEVQTVFVKAASGTYVLIAEVDGDEIEIPLEYNLSADGFRDRLRAYYEFEGIDVTAVRTSRGVTYTVAFVRFQAGRNFAELRWDGDDSGLTANNNDSIDVETDTVREGRNAPVAEVQTVLVQASGGSYLLQVEGFGRDYFDDVAFDLDPDARFGITREDESAAVAIDYSATAEDVAAALNQLFGYEGISVVEERDAATGTVVYTITFGGVEIGRNAPTLLTLQSEDFDNDGITITAIDGEPTVLTIPGIGQNNTDVELVVSFGDTAAELALQLDNLFDLTGIVVTKRVSGDDKAIFAVNTDEVLNLDGIDIAPEAAFEFIGEPDDLVFPGSSPLTYAASAADLQTFLRRRRRQRRLVRWFRRRPDLRGRRRRSDLRRSR